MRRPGSRPEVWVTVLLVVCDQLSKLLVLQRIGLHETVTVIPGLLNLTYVRNTGAAFGMLNAHDFAYKPLVVAALAILALLGILWYARKFAGDAWPARYGFVLIVAGAVGNLIDRVTLGFVVDFVDVYAGALAFLGVQRRRRGNHHRCHPVRGRHPVLEAPCSRSCLTSAR